MSLEELDLLDRAALALRWQGAFGVLAPRKCGAGLLRQALAWEIQNAATRSKDPTRILRAGLNGGGLPPGTRLVREWQGHTHHVDTVASGFDYEGRRYRSLSAIARKITGSAWSGPLFFGLRK